MQAADLPYHRMDGSTAVGARARLVDDFNNNESVFVFLLTTKVGGLGINLTGADRCGGMSAALKCCCVGMHNMCRSVCCEMRHQLVNLFYTVAVFMRIRLPGIAISAVIYVSQLRTDRVG